MNKKTIITCFCNLEIENANEYEALTIADEMLKKEYPLSEKVILIINETLNTSADGCGVTYKEKNGNVRRDNGTEGISSEPARQRKREAAG
jgi:hypothetical protein